MNTVGYGDISPKQMDRKDCCDLICVDRWYSICTTSQRNRHSSLRIYKKLKSIFK